MLTSYNEDSEYRVCDITWDARNSINISYYNLRYKNIFLGKIFSRLDNLVIITL